MHAVGVKGIVMCSNPHDLGMFDFVQFDWWLFWEICEVLVMLVNFYIGVLEGDIDWLGRVLYKMWMGDVKLLFGGVVIFFGQFCWMVNLFISDVLECYLNLNFVLVESGIGWILFVFDVFDYQCGETVLEYLKHLLMKLFEYFQWQFYGCFWFEHCTLVVVIEQIGLNCIMFEIDIFYLISFYLNVIERVRDALGGFDLVVQKLVLQDNVVWFYDIEL